MADDRLAQLRRDKVQSDLLKAVEANNKAIANLNRTVLSYEKSTLLLGQRLHEAAAILEQFVEMNKEAS